MATPQEIEDARNEGFVATHPDQNEHDPDTETELHEAWEKGWDERFRSMAITYYVAKHQSAKGRNPTVNEVADVFFITHHDVADVCNTDTLYMAGEEDTPLGQRTVEIDGE